MNEDYVTSLMKFSETNRDAYQSVLKNYQNEIIDTSGGLDAMIALCLTNPEFSTNKYKTQFDSFKSLMGYQKILMLTMMITLNVMLQSNTRMILTQTRHIQPSVISILLIPRKTLVVMLFLQILENFATVHLV